MTSWHSKTMPHLCQDLQAEAPPPPERVYALVDEAIARIGHRKRGELKAEYERRVLAEVRRIENGL